MISSASAELLRLLKWPVTWVLASVWLVLNLSFAYVFAYLSFRSAASDGDSQLANRLFGDVAMTGLPSTLVQGMPLFGGAIVLILAALATGSGYGWSTWKTVFTQGPRRLTVMGGTTVALAFIITALVAATLIVDIGASAVVMGLESREVIWPNGASLAEAIGGGLLIMTMFGAFGALLGVLARSPALSVGLGLVWTLVIENLLRGVAGQLGPLEPVAQLLPGTAAGSVAGAIGATPETADATAPIANGTPGVLTLLDGSTATILLLGYTGVFLGLLAILVHRRDA